MWLERTTAARPQGRRQWWDVSAWVRHLSPRRMLLAGYVLGGGTLLTILAALRLRKPVGQPAGPIAAGPAAEGDDEGDRQWPPQETEDIYRTDVPPPRQLGPGGPIVGADAAAIRQGFEPLSTNTRVLTGLAVGFTVLLAGTMWGLWGLLGVYMAADPPDELPASAAPALAHAVAAPLEPTPRHNDLDWQDLAHQRQRADAQLRRQGWAIDATTGLAVIPAVAARPDAVADVGAEAGADPLRFPPTYAPVHAGPYEPLTEADVFPPDGAAADAEQMRPSVYRRPTGVKDAKDLPEQTGPAGRQNDPTK